MRLIDLQRAFQAAILSSSPIELGELAPSRVWIHHRHFWTRMRDFVTARHPMLARWLGDAELDAVVRSYIAAHPPREVVGSQVAARLAELLAVTEPWSAFPIIAHFAAYEFRRTAVALAPEEVAATTIDRDRVLRLKRRAAVIATRCKFHRIAITELSRTRPLDDELSYVLVHIANGRQMTLELDYRTFLAFERLAAGITLRGLSDSMAMGDADIARFVASGLLVDEVACAGA